MRPLGVWVVFILSLYFSGAISAQETKIFRIGTGGSQGTYYPIGKLIAEGLTGRKQGNDCPQAEGCGVKGLVAVAQVSNGSVANIKALGERKIEAGLVQSDTAFWAFTGTGTYAGETRFADLRVIGHLYPESVHLAVRRDIGARDPSDLKGKRVSLDEPGSGTLINARAILAGYGVNEADLKAEYIKPHIAIERIREDRLDGFFIVAGWPTAAVTDFVAMGGVLLPIDGAGAKRVLAGNPFMVSGVIPSGAYSGIGEIRTLEVGALLVVGSQLDEGIAHGITRALWSPETLAHLRAGHPKGRMIGLATALAAEGVPLHEGAARYYRENGLLR